MGTLIPNRSLFTFEFPLRYRADLPPIDGLLTGWTDAELLPAFGTLDNRPEYAPVRACWNEQGICIATHVINKRTPLRCDPANFWKGDNLRLCTDTRPSAENKRATRFCQQFYFLPTGGAFPSDRAAGKSISNLKSEISNLNSEISNRKSTIGNRQFPATGTGTFQRAREEPPPIPTHLIRVASHVETDAYSMEAMIPAECLVGFEPHEHARMGFYYMLEDTDHGQQFLTVGDDLLWYADPSTWARATLKK